MMDTQRSWRDSYNKIHGGAVNDGLMARRAFESIVRKSSKSTHELISSDELKVYYYADSETSTSLDRSARFYRSEMSPSEFYLEHATADGSTVLSTVLLSSHVSDLEFLPIVDGYTMILSLDDGREEISVTSSALLHN
jgi:hypothetical protein